MEHDVFGRIDWLKRALGDLPPLIVFIHAQIAPSLVSEQREKISGSGERTIAPLRVDPLDDADELYAKAVDLSMDHAERAGTWRELPDSIDRQQRIVTSGQITVRGLASSDARTISAAAWDVAKYLHDHAFSLASNREYSEPVDALVADVRRARRKYPTAPDHGAWHRCPICARYAVRPDYTYSGGLLRLRCWHCGATKGI